MRFRTRYKFWQVLLGVLSICIVYIAIYFATKEPGTNKGVIDGITQTKPYPGRGFMILLGFMYFTAFWYFSLNYYYSLIASNRKFISFLTVSVVIILISLAYTSIRYFKLPVERQHESTLFSMYIEMVGLLVPMLLVSFLFAYITILREALKQKRILEAQKLLLEAQISQANFNFLKAQINPHFLHNTLNFLYAKSLPYSPELSEGILTLSDIMRYALSQGNQKEGKAPLKDEIEHVRM